MNKTKRQRILNNIIDKRLRDEKNKKAQGKRNEEFAESFKQPCGKIKVKSIITNILAGIYGQCRHKKHYARASTK